MGGLQNGVSQNGKAPRLGTYAAEFVGYKLKTPNKQSS